MNKVNVVFSTDHNFIKPLGVAIFSLLTCSTDVKCCIFILQSKDVTDEDRTILTNLVEPFNASITFSLVDNSKINNAFQVRGISTASYYRLFIPWIFPFLDNVFYLDGDIVFKKSISCFNEVNIGDNYIGGVKVIDNKGFWIKKYTPKIGCNYDEYINAGVLVVNSKKQREDKLDSIFFEHLQKKYLYQDQDILNIVCKGHIAFFNIKFNTIAKIDSVNDDTCIIHYAGKKPWKEICYYWNEWYDSYKESGFYDKKLIENILYTSINKKYSTFTLVKKIIKNVFHIS